MENKIFEPTKLLWDDYIDYLIMAIIESNCSRRTERKAMATPKRPEDSHLTSRFLHELLAALNARKIANELKINGEYAFTGMLGHDVGHPFSAHEGEVILNLIARIYNTGYFHHNAKSVEVILSEDICNKAIDKIPNITNQPDLKKQLQDEFYSFLDIIISHDGEATKSDIEKEVVEYPSMEEAVLTKLQLSNSQNKYKHIAQNIEGQLGKIADVLAYLPTDIVDGFRLGIIKDFNDDYLEAFGDMFSENENLTREEKIAIGEDVLHKSKQKTLRERRTDMNDPNNKRILQYVDETFAEAKQKVGEGLDIYDVLTDEFIKTKRDSIEKLIRESDENWDDEKEQKLMSDMNKYEEFIEKMSQVNVDTARDITSKMEGYFINDFIENSKSTGKLGFSPKAERLFYRIKELNYQYIVQYSRWNYQTEEQPEAAMQLINLCKSSLIKSGTIRDMFYDESIRDCIKDEDALTCMETPIREEVKYQEYKRKIKNLKVKKHKKHKKYKKTKDRKINKRKLISNVIDYTREKGGNFAIKYMNVYNAIPYTVRDNVEWALKNEIECQDYLIDLQRKSNNSIRKRIQDTYGSCDITEEQKEDFIKLLVEEERQKMEEKMAMQLAIDYIGGMTDPMFNDVAKKLGYIEGKKINKPKRKGVSSNVQGVLARLQKDDKSEKGKPVGTGGHEGQGDTGGGPGGDVR